MNRAAVTLALACPLLLGSYCSLSAGIGPDDDYRVVEVRFYRVDAGADTLLGIDGSAPYALETALLPGSSSSVRYFARALDDAGQGTDSQEVAVTVR